MKGSFYSYLRYKCRIGKLVIASPQDVVDQLLGLVYLPRL